MMDRVAAVALICEDIRSEKSEQDTIVGTFPDNLRIGEIPSIIPKIAAYVRIHVDSDFDPGPIRVLIRLPQGEDIQISEMSQQFVDETRRLAREGGHPYAGFISRAVLSPFQVKAAGQLKVLAQVKGEELVCAALNITKVANEGSPPQTVVPSSAD